MKLARQTLVAPIRFYRRYLSRFKPACCRYVPTCSQYAIEAIDRHGILRGSWFTTRRILRCHPFAGYGDDPVPPRPGEDLAHPEPSTPGGRSG